MLGKMHAADDHDNDNKDSDLFYDAVALTYDQSPVVREYLHSDRSRIIICNDLAKQTNNKHLWSLRHQAFKELGVWK